MKLLITGGAGYIGSFMVKRLLQDGNEVVVIDSLVRGHKQNIDPKAVFCKGDILDRQFLQHVFSQHRFDSLIHFAGYISMSESMLDPGIYFANNACASLNLIDEAIKNNVRSFIFSSTAGVYGDPVKIPIPEDHPTNPTNPYGESKLMVEKILAWYQRIYGLNFVSLRYFNAAGAALDGSLGEQHAPESHIIPKAIEAALTGTGFRLYGTDYDTSDGTCVRDYIHVLDLVQAHVLAVNKLARDNGGFFYNVGTGVGYSNKQIIEMIKKVSGIDFRVESEERRKGDAGILIADSKKIKDELGFSPSYSDLKTIIQTAWQWYKKLNSQSFGVERTENEK